MKIFDLFNGDEQELRSQELIFSENNNKEFVLSVPHSGTYFPAELKQFYRVNDLMLKDADLFTDDLYDIGEGIRVITKLNRYALNMNRKREHMGEVTKYEHEDALRGFLADGGPAWKQELSTDMRHKLLALYDLYHDILNKAMEEVKKKKGYCLMIDCHSMNSRSGDNTPDEGGRPDFNPGTLKGSSAHRNVIDAFTQVLGEKGHSVKENNPYSGGPITRKHGDPEGRMHVIQLEVNKAIYMDEEKMEKKPEDMKEVNKLIKKAVKAADDEASRL